MNAYRTVLQADLAPLAGSLFQPTGFPDLGAAEFERTPDDGTPESGRALIVESAQSMANWLEGTTWDDARNDQVTELGALPYVRVVSPDGDFLSSSRLEAHRLASAYIMDGKIGGTDGAREMDGGTAGTGQGPPARLPRGSPCLLPARPGLTGPRRVLRPQAVAVAAEDRPRRDQLHRGIRGPPGGQRRGQARRRDQRGQGRRDRRGLRHRPASPGGVHRGRRSPPTSPSTTRSSAPTGCPSPPPRCWRRWPTSRSRRCSTAACGCAPAATSW